MLEIRDKYKVTIISKRSFLSDEEEEAREPYVLPAVVTSKPEVIPIQKSFALSAALHPAAADTNWWYMG